MLKIKNFPDNRWMETIRFLSLDFMEPFYEKIGLHLTNTINFRKYLRKLIADIHSGQAEFLRKPGLVAPDALAWLQSQPNSEDFHFLSDWLENIYFYFHADRPQISGWRMFLQTSKARMQLLDCPQGKEILSEYQQQVIDTSMRKLYKQYSEEQLSMWDTEMFAVSKLCFDPDDDPLFDFIRQASESIDILKLSKFFNKSLNQNSLNCMNIAAKRYICESKIWMPEPLVEFQKLYQYDYKT